jgi:hypothetical protein
MKNLKLADVVTQQNVDLDSLKLEMMLIQDEITKDASLQRRAFLGGFKFLLGSLVVYAGVVLFAWAKYHR